MDRRTALRTLGVAATGTLAGCFGGGEPANEFEYPTVRSNGVDVPLVPVADAIEWHRSNDATFGDTRGRKQYRQTHIADAVHSPAPGGSDDDDPLEALATDERIVTYCTCPHHLAAMRAAALISDGYEHAYALDEGLNEWIHANYPVEGSETGSLPNEQAIHGRTDPAHAGAYAWAYHDPSGQREPEPIAADGTFTITFRFYDVDGDSPIRVETPAGSVRRPLGDLRSGRVEI